MARKSKKIARFVSIPSVAHRAHITVNNTTLEYIGTQAGDCNAVRIAATDEVDQSYALVFVDPQETNE